MNTQVWIGIILPFLGTCLGAAMVFVLKDPVCGSGHCNIVPYWAQRLGKSEILAHQASERGGILYCHDAGVRVKLAGELDLS